MPGRIKRWVNDWLHGQYADLTREMESFDQRLIDAEQRLNELDLRLRRSEDRAGLPHEDVEATS